MQNSGENVNVIRSHSDYRRFQTSLEHPLQIPRHHCRKTNLRTVSTISSDHTFGYLDRLLLLYYLDLNLVYGIRLATAMNRGAPPVGNELAPTHATQTNTTRRPQRKERRPSCIYS